MIENDRRNHCKRWRRDDELYVKAHINANDCDLAVKFGRSINAIRTLKYKLKNGYTTRKRG